MELTLLNGAEAKVAAVETLGMDSGAFDLFSPEALCASLRRAAQFNCPSTKGALVRQVCDSLRGLPGCPEDLSDVIELLLEALLGYGDLLELLVGDDTGSIARRIVLGPPSFVRLESGRLLLMGIRPDGTQFPGYGEIDIHTRAHTRAIEPPVDESLVADMTELTVEQWLGLPTSGEAQDVLAKYSARLVGAMSLTDAQDVSLLDPLTKPTYYKGRWRPVEQKDHGTYVLRRARAYGAAAWSFGRLSGGEIIGIVDLPTGPSSRPGRDEAWRLQAAIDATNGTPQLFNVAVIAGSTARLDFFSPLTSWAQRFLDAIGTPTARHRSLITYEVPRSDVDAVASFLERNLWMVMTATGKGG